ncbi:MAG: excinuclease ABC subunit UvrC [Anaerolineaceae bacterium]|nr:excinuclease ABC subunit UvrC [Anaerolineaceae bacterium]
MEWNDHIRQILDTLPDKPGCYLMKNDKGKIIYVGKAINLRNRVRSYFHATALENHKTHRLVQDIADIEWIVVGSELEALILEMTLIKRHRPQYNVRLKDDKRYPYIKVHWQDPFPKVTITRQMQDNGARYFGPYTSVWALHQTLDLLRKIFPYLTCNREITGNDSRACLYYDIKLCTAPCIGAISKADYRQVIDDLCKFLEGRTEPVVLRLNQAMEKAAEDLQYEKAATIRDQLQAIDKVVERQKVVSSDQTDSDVIAMARSDGEACVQVFFIRSGKLIGREYFVLEGTEEEKDQEILEEFVKQFYSQAAFVPQKVLLPTELEEAQIINTWLNSRSSGEKVEITVPHHELNQSLIDMATENAVETLTALKTRWEADKNRQTGALTELQEALGLSEPPNRIECYDISTTQGVASVGSMVVFEQGTPNKKLYRRFNIKTVLGQDDFASMEEVLFRRFRRWKALAEEEGQVGKKPDLAFSILPDLLLVDGGKGQLSRAVKVLEEYNLLDRVPVAGLAKQEEELFLPDQHNSIFLERHSAGLYLVQRIRDEAHRFAITAHRKRREKQGLASRLDVIPGIGPTRRRQLLQKFGSVDGIQKAAPEEIAEIKGITLEMAQSIKTQLE